MTTPATKPTDDLAWSNAGVEPSGSKKSTGWVDDEEPPAEIFNWFFTTVSNWQAYLRDIFNQTVTFLNDTSHNAASDDSTPDIVFTFPNATQKRQIQFPGVIPSALYSISGSGGASGVAFVCNAQWVPGTSKWTQINNALSFRVGFTNARGFFYESKAAGAADWNDNAWSDKGLLASFADALILGTALNGSFVGAQSARLVSTRVAAVTSLFTLVKLMLSAAQHVRIYRGPLDTEDFSIAFNCSRLDDTGAGHWQRDTSNNATLIQFSAKRMRVLRTAGASATWTDDASGWELGFPWFQLYWGADEAIAFAARNTMYPNMFPKAWGNLRFAGLNGSLNQPTVQGANLGVVLVSTISGIDTIAIALDTPMVDDQFTVLALVASQPGSVTIRAMTGLPGSPAAYNGATGSNWAGYDITIAVTKKITSGGVTTFQLDMGLIGIITGNASQNYKGDVQFVVFGVQ